MRYDKDKLNELAEQVDIVDYIGKKYELKSMGKNIYVTHCPFHDGDHTASLTVYGDTNSWFCFGCKRGRNIYDWLRQDEGLTFHEAVEKVTQLTGGNIEDTVVSDTIAFFKNCNRTSIQKPVAILERKQLDFDKDYVQLYSDDLPKEWLEEGITEEALRYYNIRVDIKKDRIVYPVFDSEDRFISVKGRTRVPNFKEYGITKYINYYKIGVLDYFQGWQQAVSEIISTKSVIIFEGVKSCMKAYGWGIKNTVASETSLLTEEQVKLLIKNGIGEVIFAYDKDQSFQKIANNKCTKLLTNYALVSIIIDNKGLLGEKDAPVDQGKDVFLKLLYERRRL